MSRQDLLEITRSQAPAIAPSILACDFGNLHREVELLEAAGARLLHLDVMDGHFVPNLTFGPVVISHLRPLTDLPFDVHLMISNPATMLEDYLAAGCDGVTVHVECFSDDDGPEALATLLQRISDGGAAAGLALNPQTPVEAVRPWLGLVDLVLLMSVEPGFGGQSFLPGSLEKIAELSSLLPERVTLSVDGGINRQTIKGASAAGARLFVAGSAVFGAADYAHAIAQLLEEVGDHPAAVARSTQEAC